MNLGFGEDLSIGCQEVYCEQQPVPYQKKASFGYTMNGPQRTAVSRKELLEKRKQKEFLKRLISGARNSQEETSSIMHGVLQTILTDYCTTPPPKKKDGGHAMKCSGHGSLLEHTQKPYTDRQLCDYNPLNMNWWTRNIYGHHDTGRTISKSYSRQAVNSLCETITKDPRFRFSTMFQHSWKFSPDLCVVLFLAEFSVK